MMNSPVHEESLRHDISRIFGEDYQFSPTGSLSSVKRVALFAETFFPRFDGASQAAYNTLRYLQQTGREVLIFAPDDAPDHIGPSEVVRLPSVRVPQYSGLRVALPVAEVNARLAEFQPDLIHLSAPVAMSARAIAYGRRHNIPLVAIYTTNLPQYMAWYGVGYLQGAASRWLRFLHNRCTLTLAPSTTTLECLRQHQYKGLGHWPNGVNERRFNPANRSSEWRMRLLNGRDPESLVCICVGRLANEKNIESLHSVAAMPGVALTIIGHGPDRQHLEKVFQGTGAHFTGGLFGRELASAYASADAFVFPSRTETFGLVTLEAMASGLPVVVSDQGGASDFVRDGETGFLCPDQDSFGRAVTRLHDDKALRLALGKKARQVAECHTWNRVMAQLECYYANAVEECPCLNVSLSALDVLS